MPLGDQENIICTLTAYCSPILLPGEQYAKGDSHIAPHGSYMWRQGTHKSSHRQLYANGTLCASTINNALTRSTGTMDYHSPTLVDLRMTVA